jgi:hypothetical protein
MMSFASLKRVRPARLWYLLRNRVLEDAPAAGIVAAIILGSNLLSLVFARRAAFNAGGDQAWTMVIWLGGFLLAAAAFKRMHDGKAGTEWILLPAEPVEKYLAALVAYAFVAPLLFSAAAWGLSALLALAERAAGGPGAFVWTPVAAGGLKAWAGYAIAVTLFLAGSASFRKIPFLKTIGVLVLVGLAAAAIFAAGAWLLSGGSGRLSLAARDGVLSLDDASVPAGARRAVSLIAEVSVYGLAPLFALLFGWAKVAEKEARDEVQ